jgi:hypothetical protein
MKIEALSTNNIENFSLRWRWTDEKYCLMPEDDLSKINPLTPEAAKITFDTALRLIEETQIVVDGESIETSLDRGAVKVFLTSRLPEGKIIVNWGQDTSVIMDTTTFIKYWDDICYPSSDDVSVWSEDESWLLQYYHFEKFSFIKR